MDIALADLIRLAGAGQLSVLIASSLVPYKLNWKRDLETLPKLHRQMYWTYGGYIVMGIVALGGMSLVCAEDLVSGSRLGRAVCVYGALFWGIRLSLQAVFDVKSHLTVWWLVAGYHTLTVLFLFFTAIYGYAALH
jgi:hypothetical protein